MPKTEVKYVWNADVEIELRDLCLSVTYDVEKRGSRSVRILKPTGWLKGDEIYIDFGKRLKGWFKQQAKTIRPSLAESLRYGLTCDTLPQFGPVAVAKRKEIIVNKDFPEQDKTEYELGSDLSNIGYPFKEVFVTGEGAQRRSVFTFHYLIEKPIKAKIRIKNFSRGFMPESAKSMLTELGPIIGLGDGYSQGHGCFKLISFTFDIKELKI